MNSQFLRIMTTAEFYVALHTQLAVEASAALFNARIAPTPGTRRTYLNNARCFAERARHNLKYFYLQKERNPHG